MFEDRGWSVAWLVPPVVNKEWSGVVVCVAPMNQVEKRNTKIALKQGSLEHPLWARAGEQQSWVGAHAAACLGTSLLPVFGEENLGGEPHARRWGGWVDSSHDEPVAAQPSRAERRVRQAGERQAGP